VVLHVVRAVRTIRDVHGARSVRDPDETPGVTTSRPPTGTTTPGTDVTGTDGYVEATDIGIEAADGHGPFDDPAEVEDPAAVRLPPARLDAPHLALLPERG
jgi:hypothetical protein